MIHCQLSIRVLLTWLRRQFKCRLQLITSCSLHRQRTWDLITWQTISISISFSTSNPFLRSQNNRLRNSHSQSLDSRPCQSRHSSRPSQSRHNSRPNQSRHNSRPSQSRHNSRLQQSQRRLSLHLRPLHLRRHLCLQMCTTQCITRAKIPRTCTTALSISRCLSTSPSQE